MNELVEQYVSALDKFPKAEPDKIIQTYLGSARAKNDQEALRLLTIVQDFLDNQLVPNGTDLAAVSLCKRIAERMVKLETWSESVLGQFSQWPPEADVTH